MGDRAKGILIGGIIMSCVFVSILASDLINIYKGNKDIWWTPASMMLSLSDVKDKFEIYISGRPMADYIENGALLAEDKEGKQYKVVSRDMGFRVNNWDKQKLSILEKALFSAFGAGIGIALLIVGVYLKRFQR